MNITVFGASGGVGAHVVSRADLAWHILDLAEDPDPSPHRTPVITSGTSPATRAAEGAPPKVSGIFRTELD